MSNVHFSSQTDECWRGIRAMPDLYENPHTTATTLDEAVHGMTWK